MRWLGLAFWGCGEPKDGGAAEACEPGPNPTVRIGTGEQAFEPMPDEVVLVHGPQGGYHVVVSFDASFLDASEVIEAVVEGTIDGEPVAVSEAFFELGCNAETGTLQWLNTLLIYPLTPVELADQPTTITAVLTDATGASANASVDTTIVDPLVD